MYVLLEYLLQVYVLLEYFVTGVCCIRVFCFKGIFCYRICSIKSTSVTGYVLLALYK